MSSIPPALATAKGDIETLVQQIKDKGRDKREATAGKTEKKQQAEDAMILALVKVASSLYSFARRTKKSEVAAIADVTESQLRKIRDTELASMATSIHTSALANVAALADYGVTPAVLTDLQTKTAAFSTPACRNALRRAGTALGDRESSVAERVGAGAALGDLFDQMDELLKDELDRLIETVRESERDFYNEYFAARVIKDIGIRHTKPNQPPPTPPPPAPAP